MAPIDFTIELDNHAGSYFPGQNVGGRVVVVLEQSKNCQGLKIEFTGKAVVHWVEEVESKSTGNNTKTSLNYDDHDDFFDYKVYILGDERSNITIPSGRNEFPFQFPLPMGLPSSFIGAYGSVRYNIKAIIKRSWKFDHEVEKGFTVNGILDLNTNPIASTAGELKKHKNLCCLCCQTGPIGIYCKLPKRGFVPGEFIEVEAEITNMSSRNLTEVSLQLYQTSTYYAKGKSKSSTTLLSKVKRPGVGPGDTDIWAGKLLQIPSVPPTKLGNCRIIDVAYELKVEVTVSGPALNLSGTIPIVIGTIPFKQNPTAPGMRGTSIKLPGMSSKTDPIIAGYPDIPPPSYAAAFPTVPLTNCTLEDIENQIIKADEYIPNYATYGWSYGDQSTKL